MSKSMWADATAYKPDKKNDTDKFSVDVFYWVEGEKLPTMGCYNFAAQVWVNGIYRQINQPNTVKYFAYIDNPYK